MTGSTTIETGLAGAHFLVVVGGSAGSLAPLLELLRGLPHESASVVLARHSDRGPSNDLADIVGRETRFVVSEIADGARPAAGCVYIAPGAVAATIDAGRFRLETDPDARTIDTLFASSASALGSAAVAVLLSGASTDGVEGLRDIRTAGGVALVQEPATAEHAVMPRGAIDAGLADAVLPPSALASAVLAHAWPALRLKPNPDDGALDAIIPLIRERLGTDFAAYKRPTLLRRLARRAARSEHGSLAEYVASLDQNDAELAELANDLLIGVTSFFRDPEVFAAITEHLAPICRSRHSHDTPIRIWVPACATGEEAWSYAMIVAELLDENPDPPEVSIFATDLSQVSVDQARTGVYPRKALDGVAPARVARFFDEQGGQLIAKPLLKTSLLFSRHDLLHDPPFSHVDVVSCRNLLIYLTPKAQLQLARLFHYALRPSGLLVLGRSEHLGPEADELFDQLEQNRALHRRRGSARASRVPLPSPRRTPQDPRIEPAWTSRPNPGLEIRREAERIIMRRYAPPSVVVDQALQVLEFRNSTGRFLDPAPGAATLDVLRLLRDGLQLAVKPALEEARASGVAVRKPGVRYETPEGAETCNVEVVPVRVPGSDTSAFLILFEDVEKRQAPVAVGIPSDPSELSDEQREIVRLREELAATRSYLESVIEDQKAVNAELQAANAETQSSNEELQAANEELETAKEELQSGYEELRTVNEELELQNARLAESRRALAQSQEELRLLFESLPVGVAHFDLEGRFVHVNPAWATMLGYAPEELVGKSFAAMAVADAPSVGEARRALREMQAANDDADQLGAKRCLLRKDGSTTWVLASAATLRDADGKPRKVFASITSYDAEIELQRQEEEELVRMRSSNRVLKDQLLAASNLAALGTLAAGIAHELNQPLTVLTMGLGMLERVDGPLEKERATIQQLIHATALMAKVIDGVRTFGRQDRFELARVPAAAPVRRALTLLGAQLREVAVETRLDALPDIHADASRLEQVFINLLANARDALKTLPRGRERLIRVSAQRDGNHIEFCVDDSGDGVPAEHRQEIFLPFFSLKDKDSGTGLGLALCHTIVEEHGGSITIGDAPGGGARFTVRIPIFEED